jgi:pectinesterase
MRTQATTPLYCTLTALALFTAARAEAQPPNVVLFPANLAHRVNPDTHLVLTFSSPPTLGNSGQIRILDAADRHSVDILDLSIAAGPDPSRRIAPRPAPVPAPDTIAPTSPTTTTPAVKTTPADLHDYQLTTIGGLPDFHFYPVIIHGNVATIYPHNNVLRYNHTYLVEIDPGVLTPSAGAFAGFTAKHPWRFTTKPEPPPANATRVVVAADGSGDFNTVQGAVDFVPENPPQRVTIFIRNGTYEEIVFFRDKSNLSFRGEDRDKVQIGYGNNSAFNPPMPGPSRRCAFSAYNSTGIHFINFSVSNYYFGQAEGLLISGSKNIVSHVTIKGSGDALNLRGSVYLTDSTIIGDGDTILGVGPAFFRHCQLSSVGPFMWIRNTEANHGNVFVHCTFTARQRLNGLNRPAGQPSTAFQNFSVLARLPNNHGLNYPYAEAVLTDCRLSGIPPVGWGPIDGDTAHIHFWEFHSTDPEGHPIDVSQRHPASRQLTEPQDARIIANYRDPAFVLDGWNPLLDIAE